MVGIGMIGGPWKVVNDTPESSAGEGGRPASEAPRLSPPLPYFPAFSRSARKFGRANEAGRAT